MIRSSKGVLISVLVFGLLASSVAQAQPERPQFGTLTLSGGPAPFFLSAGDVDEDGWSDLAVTHNNLFTYVTVQLNPADSYLSAPQAPSGGQLDEANPLTFGYLDADTHLDLIVAPYYQGEVSTFLGDGSGDFAFVGSYSVGGDLGTDVAVGDLTGDGFPDVVVSMTANPSLGGLWFLPGNGDGTLGAGQQLDSGDYWAVELGHIDGDLHLDIVTDDYVYLGDGMGGFTVFPGVGGGAIADFNGDGEADLADGFSNSSTDIVVRLGNGDGTFAPGVAYPGGAWGGHSLLAVDITGDGIVDLVETGGFDGGGGIAVLPGNGDGTFGVAHRSRTGFGFGLDVAVADLNHDGFLDAVVSVHGSLVVFLNNRDGTFLNRTSDISGSSVAKTLVDLDSDGNLDFISFYPLGTVDVEVAFGSPDGSTTTVGSIATLDNPIAAAAADFAGNGSTHIAVLADPSPTGPTEKVLRTLFNLGGGAFTITPVETPVSLHTSAMISAELNGDGKPDILATDEVTHEVLVLLGQGNLLFSSPQAYPVGVGPVAIDTGLLDGDAHLDLVVANRDSDDVAVLLGNGDGTFQPASFIGFVNAPVSLALGDLNEDAFLDLAVTGQSETAVSLGNGDGSFGPAVTVVQASGGRPVFGDFDRDGQVDLFAGQHFLRGLGDGSLESVSRHGDLVFFVADFDHDGWLDLASYNHILFNQGSPDGLGFEADGVTMRWPGVLGADSYGIYRGDMSLLVDVDTDGLPDGGYGVCLSGADPDPTDTIFSDPDVPTVGGDGFFYIRSVVSAVGEDLGSTSGGLTRVPSVFCP